MSSASAVPYQSWRGNLPCCHGNHDGCENHNPQKLQVFYVKNLLSHTTTGTGSGAQAGADLLALTPIGSYLPRNPTTIDPLPRIHSNVPYSLAFYHVNTAIQQVISSPDAGAAPGTLLVALACRGTSGSRPTINWTVRPKIAASASGPTFLVQYCLSFSINATVDGDTSDFASTSYSKNWFVSPGFRNFTLCPHMRRVFRSHWTSTTRQQGRRAGVAFSLKNVLKQEFEAEWRSELGIQPVNMCCRMCYTDSSLNFHLERSVVRVSLVVYKDLGNGLVPTDPKWVAALRGTATQREKSDFMRMRRAFADASGPSIGPAELG